jgi:ATP-dependent RNA helicase RhlE
MAFDALGLGPKITRAVREAEYTQPTPIQAEAIPVILSGSDVIGVAQTGTGKTAAFVLPMLEKLAAAPRKRHMRALVIAPTRELVLQIEENVRNYSRHVDVKIASIYGGVGEKPQISALKNGVDLVVATPGRLIDLMDQKYVHFEDIEFVVLDEADRMLDMGFLPSIKRIARRLPAQRQTLLFSATISPEIERIAAEFLQSPKVIEIGPRRTPIATVEQLIYEVPASKKVELLIHLLQRDDMLDTVLVFSRTKYGADKIARKLTQARIPTATIHSNRSQGQRLKALEQFKNGNARVLVATDIAARGIDVEGISHVINYDFPPAPEDYVHRIGRTGRANAEGDAISFVTPEDYLTVRKVEKALGSRIPRARMEGYSAPIEQVAPMVPVRASSTPAPARPMGARRRARCW